jgi:ferritin
VKRTMFNKVINRFFDMSRADQDKVLRHLLQDYLDEVREDFGEAGEKLALASMLERMEVL